MRRAAPRAQDRRRLLLVRGTTAVQRLLAITAVGEHFETVSDVPADLFAPAAALCQA